MTGNLGLALLLVITIGFTFIGLSEGTVESKNSEELKCSRCDNEKNDDTCFKSPPDPVSCGSQGDLQYKFVYCDVVFPFGGSTNKKNFARGCLYTKKEHPPSCFIYDGTSGQEKPEALDGVAQDAKVCICPEEGCNKDPFEPEPDTTWPAVGPFPAPKPTTIEPTTESTTSTPAGGGGSPGDGDGVECLQSMSFLVVLALSLVSFYAF